jgi:pimeloyl-ACP methyl ester carboxylesterase
MPDFWPLLPQVRQPVQLVVGSLDDKFVRLAEKALTLLPSATLHVVPDVGHNAVLEAPAAVAALLTKNRQQ